MGFIDKQCKLAPPTALAVHSAHRSLPAAEPHPPPLRRTCHLRSADFQLQGLLKLQFRDRLCIRTRCTQASSTCGPRNNSSGRPCATTPSSRYWCKCTSGMRQGGAQITRRRSGLLAPCLCPLPLWRCISCTAVPVTRFRQPASVTYLVISRCLVNLCRTSTSYRGNCSL